MTGRMPRPPERYHADQHEGEFAGCWRCQRAAAICRSKRSFDTYEAADAAVREVNEREGYASPLVRYRCRWCPGWHMTTARTRVRVKRAEKQRRKWLAGPWEPTEQVASPLTPLIRVVPGMPADTLLVASPRLDEDCRRRECDHVHEVVARFDAEQAGGDRD